jgi:hypothetical protein
MVELQYITILLARCGFSTGGTLYSFPGHNRGECREKTRLFFLARSATEMNVGVSVTAQPAAS